MLLFPLSGPAYKAATGFVFLPTSEVQDIYCTKPNHLFVCWPHVSQKGDRKEEKEKYLVEINTHSFGMSRV